MTDVLAKKMLFPEILVTEMMNLAKGKSSLSKLSASKPIPFNGTREFIFTMDKEIDIVAENGKKTKGGATVEPVTIMPVKVEYGARISDEFDIASEEVQMDYLSQFAEGFAKKVARGIDIMALHGFNPRTGTASDIIGNNCFEKKITNTVDAATGDANEQIEAAVALVEGSENDVNGVIMSKDFKSSLAKLKFTNGTPMFPELAWGANPEQLNGLNAESNSTVSCGGAKQKALVGDFENAFKWGFAKEVPIDIIRHGNPDNDETLGDLKGHNQIYLRGEAYIGWGILDPKSFAIVKQN